MQHTRWLPMGLILFCTTIIYFLENPEKTYVYFFASLLTLPFIYFGDEIGSFTGWHWRTLTYIDEPTPGIFLKIIGWILLITISGLMILRSF